MRITMCIDTRAINKIGFVPNSNGKVAAVAFHLKTTFTTGSFNNLYFLFRIRSGNKGLLKFYQEGNHSIMEKEVDEHYAELREKSDYVSQVWMGIDYARAGARDKALDCFNNAIALKETAITFLLLRHFDFLNIKYLSMALITRKIRQVINF